MADFGESGSTGDVTESTEVVETTETTSEIDDDISNNYGEYKESGKAQEYEHKSAEEKEALREESHLNCPRENGQWKDGEESRGESKWIPNRDYVPPDNGKGNNPEGKTMGQIMDENGIDGITYKNGEPDFSDVSYGEVEIEDFSDNRTDNFRKADTEYAERHNKEHPDDPMTPGDVKDIYREQNKLTWHEHRDCSTMEMVPREIHANFSHRGGVSESKKRSE